MLTRRIELLFRVAEVWNSSALPPSSVEVASIAHPIAHPFEPRHPIRATRAIDSPTSTSSDDFSELKR